MQINHDIVLTDMQVGGIFCEQNKDDNVVYWNIIKERDSKFHEKTVSIKCDLYRIYFDNSSTIELLSDNIEVDSYYISHTGKWKYAYFDTEESKPIIEKLSKLHALYTIAKEAINAFCSSAPTPYVSSLS